MSEDLPKVGMKSQSAMEYLVTYGWAIIIIAVVLAALFNLGVFSAPQFVSTTCIFPAEFSCLSAILYNSNSTLSVNLQQATDSSINVTAIGCNNKGTVSDMVAVSPQVTIPIGDNYTFSALCYGNGTVESVPSGQLYKGYVIVNYTDLQTNFPHTVEGTLVAKVV